MWWHSASGDATNVDLDIHDMSPINVLQYRDVALVPVLRRDIIFYT